jgi:hypothetical protein
MIAIERQIEGKRGAAAQARRLAGTLPDGQIRRRMLDMAARLEAEADALAHISRLRMPVQQRAAANDDAPDIGG